MSEENRRVALRFMDAMGSNDAESAAECLAEDAVAVAKGTTNFAGTRSREMMLGGIAAFTSILPEGLRFSDIRTTAEGDRVLVEAKGNGVTAGGEKYDNDYCFAMTFRDGKIAHVNEYFCTKLADGVLWPLVQGTGNLDSTVD
ncbi:MAG: nuclear transport factor 2 family protein [Sphingomonadaceae bacterium]